MRIEFTVRLPVDSSSVPFVRGLCRQALEHMSVEKQTIDEVVLALSEACANAVRHSGAHSDYEVLVCMDDDVCRLSVFDHGEGFEPRPIPERPDPLSDDGHGLLLMRALVDELNFTRDPDGRHCVVLEKRLTTPPPLRLVNPV
jgi:serine/threonine-protein kinase RsbW